jgi:PAS domain S-box-containing protein
VKPPGADIPPPSRDALRATLRVVLLYALFASLWILLSDRAVALLFNAPESLQSANTLKGLLFVAVTSVLLFFLVLRFAARHAVNAEEHAKVGPGGTARAPLRKEHIAGIALLSLAFALLGASGILQNAQRHRAEAGERLAAIAELKAAQIEAWLEERRRDAEVVRTAPLLRDDLPHWRRTGDAAMRQRLQSRLEGFRTSLRYAEIMLCDARGDILLQTAGDTHGMDGVLRATVKEAVAAGETRLTDLFLMTVDGVEHAHLDIVAPIPSRSGENITAAIVLRIDVVATLYAFMQSWPVPSATSETLLFRPDGDSVLFLNELRHEAGTALRKRVPLSDTRVLAVQGLAPDHAPGTLLEGIDYRGTPVLGVVRPIAGTSWRLVAKTDSDEIDAPARKDALWIGFSSLLTWFAVLTLALLYFQRRELLLTQRQHSAQEEKLRALQLLEAIANTSTDAIFAKDTRGRYLLFNAEAERVTGKRAEEMLGRDDTALFPPEQAAQVMADDRVAMQEARTVTFTEKLDTVDGEVVFLATKGPLRDASGKVVGLFGISRDITRIKHAEEALHRQAAELSARNAELERFNRAMVGRELDMIALKRAINALSRELGRAPPFDLPATDAGDTESGR